MLIGNGWRAGGDKGLFPLAAFVVIQCGMLDFILRREKMLGVILIIVFFLLNLSIASRSPFGAWMDEVTYVDPGLNLASGKGWVSSNYPWQTDHACFAGTSPLYPGALSLWAHLFGVSMVSARSYSYFLAGFGVFLLWLGAYRFHLLTPAYRLFWIIFLSTEYAMNWMARDERYDVWIFVGLALAWLGASLRLPPMRFSVVFLGSFLVPLGGFVGVPYIFFAAVLATVLTRAKFWKEAIAAMIGAGTGVFAVALFFAALGMLGTFYGILGHMTVGEQSRIYSVSEIFVYPRQDYGTVLMIALLIVLSFYYWKHPSPEAVPWMGLGWGMVILLPCVMLLRGVFVMMYFYLLIIPLSLALLQLISQAEASARRRYLAWGATVAMAFLCLGGLPARIYTSAKEWDFRNPQHRQDFIRTYVHPDDAVYSDFPFYYELRDYAKFSATPFYYNIMPSDESTRINVVLVGDSIVPDSTGDLPGLSKFGSGWKKVAVFPTPEMVSNSRGVPAHETFTLYRRDIRPN